MASASAQAFHVLCSIVYHVLVAAFLFPWHLLRCLLGMNSKVVPSMKTATFWEGEVYHIRRQPKYHQFKYPVRTAFVNLEKPPPWFRQQQKDHLLYTDAKELARTDGPIFLLTNPISAGYHQNPISVYYCYSASMRLQQCIAEVTNTPWGERVTFLFDPRGAHVPKALHVSPMMDMQNTWYLEASDPLLAGQMKLVVNADHPAYGAYFNASLVATTSSCPHSLNEMSTLDILIRYGYQPHRIAFWIYMHAIQLLAKGVPLYGQPAKSFQKEVHDKAIDVPSLPAGNKFVWRESRTPVWR